jgi:hypothetical protein
MATTRPTTKIPTSAGATKDEEKGQNPEMHKCGCADRMPDGSITGLHEEGRQPRRQILLVNEGVGHIDAGNVVCFQHEQETLRPSYGCKPVT